MEYPIINENAYVAKECIIIGNVQIGEDVGVWFHATIRGDRESVIIKKGTNIQDNAVVHVDQGYPVKIGEYVTIGHGAIIHGCEIGDNTLIGMGAIVLNGAKIGKNCIIGAGALVTQNMEIPDNVLVMGTPGKVKREVTMEEIESNYENAVSYVEESKEYKNLGF